MRKIKKIVIHCSDSDHAHHDNINTIRSWHLERGFRDVGYNYFINKMGRLEIGRPINQTPAHAKGYNSSSIGICLSGKSSHLFTDMQYKTLAKICSNLLHIFDLEKKDIYAHYELNPNKTCPNFDIGSFVENYMER